MACVVEIAELDVRNIALRSQRGRASVLVDDLHPQLSLHQVQVVVEGAGGIGRGVALAARRAGEPRRPSCTARRP